MANPKPPDTFDEAKSQLLTNIEKELHFLMERAMDYSYTNPDTDEIKHARQRLESGWNDIFRLKQVRQNATPRET